MKVLVATVSALCGLAVAWSASAQAPSLATVFGHAKTIESVSISPDGHRLAIIGSDGSAGNLTIATIDTDEVKHLKFGPVEPVGVTWIGNDYLVARVAAVEKEGVFRYRIERNVVVTADGRLGPKLLEHDVAARRLIAQRVLGVTREAHPRLLLLSAVDAPGGFGRVVLRIDPATGVAEPVARGDDLTRVIGFDPEGQTIHRLQVGMKDVVSLETLDDDGKTWTRRWTSRDKVEADHFNGYSAKDNGVYLVDEDGDGGRLTLLHLGDKSVTPVGPSYKLSPLTYLPDPHSGRPVAAASVSAGSIDFDWFDADLGKVEASVVKALGGRHVILDDWSSDRTRFVVMAYSPDASTAWYLYDRARHQISPIGEELPALAGAALGRTQWITYRAQDGKDISAYLTLPHGAPDQGARLPLIVMPHSGPAARDRPDLDLTVQFLAARGYAVLRPQFRGSVGSGKSFQDAGDREWGGKMQTDLTDGVAWLAASRIVDPARVCIIGEGFGGYAALAAVTLHPGAYRCAVSLAGASDLIKLAHDTALTRGADTEGVWAWREKLRKVGAADPLLPSISPDRFAANVRAPILLIDAQDDAYVGAGQTDLMRDALTRAGKPAEVVVLNNTDRHLRTTAARTQFLETLGAFLAKNLPVAP